MPRRYIGCCPSDYEQIDEFLDRRRLKALRVPTQLENGLAHFRRKAAGKVFAEFRFEQARAEQTQLTPPGCLGVKQCGVSSAKQSLRGISVLRKDACADARKSSRAADRCAYRRESR